MEHVPVESILPNLIIGLITVSLGALIIRYRRKLNEAVFKAQQSMFGQGIAQASAGRQKPFMMGAVGLFGVLLGLAMLAGAVVGIVQLGS